MYTLILSVMIQSFNSNTPILLRQTTSPTTYANLTTCTQAGDLLQGPLPAETIYGKQYVWQTYTCKPLP